MDEEACQTRGRETPRSDSPSPSYIVRKHADDMNHGGWRVTLTTVGLCTCLRYLAPL